jgi:hypothetical protein
MSEEKVTKAEAGQPAEVANKKKRRGISNETRATSRLKFDDVRDANKANGLFQGHLESVEVKDITIGEETTGMPSFNGMTVPKLILTFASNHPAVAERRYISMQFLPAESNVDTIPNGSKAWQVDRIMAYLKHLLDVYLLKGKPMSEEQEDALTLAFEDFDDNGEYVSVDPTEVINGWRVLFENFANIMNTGKDGKPIYVTADGKIIPIWMKLLRFTKNKGQWKPVEGGNRAGDLAFPGFVGEGVIELFVTNKAPILKVNATKEKIAVMDIAKTPTNPAVPGMPGAPMGGVPAGFGDGMGADNGSPIPAFPGAGEDLPF